MNKLKALEYLRRPENAAYLVMLFISVVISLLGFFTDIFKENRNIVYLCSATLMVLSGITFITLITHNVITQIKERLGSPGIDETIHSFGHFHDEIQKNILNAEEIWLISRTGRGWWTHYFKERFENKDKDLSAKFLFVDSDSPAVDMIKAGSDPDWVISNDNNIRDDNYLRNDMKKFYRMLFDKINHNQKILNKSENILRCINYLPPWTLLIINPTKKNADSVVYVELGRFTADYLSRDTFKVYPGVSSPFDAFIDEFEKVWSHERLTKRYDGK